MCLYAEGAFIRKEISARRGISFGALLSRDLHRRAAIVG